MTFDGKPLLTGGKVNSYEFDCSPEQLSKAEYGKRADTGYKAVGDFLAGFNQDMSQAKRDVYGPSKSAYKGLKVYLSTSNMQKPEAVAEGNGVAASLKN